MLGQRRGSRPAMTQRRVLPGRNLIFRRQMFRKYYLKIHESKLQLFLFIISQCGDRLYTSESDVYGRQILTYNVSLDSRAERVTYL